MEDYDALNTIRRKEPALEIILKLDLINFITNKLLIYPYYLTKDEGEWIILEEEELNNPASESWRKKDVSYKGYKYSLRFRVFEKLFFQNWSLTKGAGMLLGRSTYVRYAFKIVEAIRKHYNKKIQEALNKNDDKKLSELVEKKEKTLSEFIEKSTYILMSIIQFEGKQHEDFRKKNVSPKGNRRVTELLQQEDIDDLFRYIEEPFGEVVRNMESVEAESVKSAESEADKGNAIDFNKVLKSINTLYEKLNKSEEDKLKVVKIMKKLADEKVEKNEGPYILWKTGWKNFVKNIWTSLKIIAKGDKKGSIKESLISHRGKRTWQKITIATLLFNLLLLGAVVSLIHLKFQVFGIVSPWIGWLITILSTGAIVVSVWALLFHKFRPLAFVVLTGISTVVVYLAKMYGFAIGMAAFGVGVIIWVLLLPLTWYSFRDIVGSFVSWRAREKQFERRSGIKFRHSLIFRWTGLGGRKLAKTLNKILYDKEGKERLNPLGISYKEYFLECILERIEKKGVESLDYYLKLKEVLSNPNFKSLPKPKDRELRREILEWIRNYFKKKPPLEGYERKLTETHLISAGGTGTPFYFKLGEILSLLFDKSSNKWNRDTYAHYLKRRFSHRFDNLKELIIKELFGESVIRNKDVYKEIAKLLFEERDVNKEKIEALRIPTEIKDRLKEVLKIQRLLYLLFNLEKGESLAYKERILQIEKKIFQDERALRDLRKLSKEIIKKVIEQKELDLDSIMKKYTSLKNIKEDIFYLIEESKKLLTNAGAQEETIRNLSKNYSDEKVNKVLDIYEKFINRHIPTRWKLIESLTSRREAERKYAEYYYPDSKYQELRKRIKRGESLKPEEEEYLKKVEKFYEELVWNKLQIIVSEGRVQKITGINLGLPFNKPSDGDIEKECRKALGESKRAKEAIWILKLLRDLGLEHTRSDNTPFPEGDGLVGRKYAGAWAPALPQIRGDYIVTWDSHQEFSRWTTYDFLRIPTEFNFNSKLGIILTKIFIYTEGLTNHANVYAVMEHSWLGPVMRFYNWVSTLGFYGKGIIRFRAFLKYEGLQDDYVSEDIITAFVMMLRGLTVKYIDYVHCLWRSPLTVMAALVPLSKYAAGAVEFFMRKQFKRLMRSPYISWHKKLGLLSAASHHFRKPWVTISIVAVVVLCLLVNNFIYPLNPFLGLPFGLVFVLSAVLITMAINLFTTLYYTEEKACTFQGITEAIKRIIIGFPFYVLLIPFYVVRGISRGVKGQPTFITTSKELPLIKFDDYEMFKEVEHIWAKIGTGLFILSLMAPSKPLLLLVFGSYVAALWSWAYGIYLYNFREDKEDISDFFTLNKKEWAGFSFFVLGVITFGLYYLYSYLPFFFISLGSVFFGLYFWSELSKTMNSGFRMVHGINFKLLLFISVASLSILGFISAVSLNLTKILLPYISITFFTYLLLSLIKLSHLKCIIHIKPFNLKEKLREAKKDLSNGDGGNGKKGSDGGNSVKSTHTLQKDKFGETKDKKEETKFNRIKERLTKIIKGIKPKKENNPIKAARKYFKQATILNLGGKVDEAQEFFEKALLNYNKAIKSNPQNEELYCERGTVLLNLGRADEAVSDFNEALRINPEYPEAYLRLGELFKEREPEKAKEFFNKALTYYNRLIENNPSDDRFYCDRGVVYMHLGQIEEAIKDFEKAIEINPESAEAYYNLISARLMKEDNTSSSSIFNSYHNLLNNLIQSIDSLNLHTKSDWPKETIDWIKELSSLRSDTYIEVLQKEGYPTTLGYKLLWLIWNTSNQKAYPEYYSLLKEADLNILSEFVRSYFIVPNNLGKDKTTGLYNKWYYGSTKQKAIEIELPPTEEKIK